MKHRREKSDLHIQRCAGHGVDSRDDETFWADENCRPAREKEPKRRREKAIMHSVTLICHDQHFHRLASSYLSYIAEAEEQTLKSNGHTARQSTCCVGPILIFRHQFKKYLFDIWLNIKNNGCGCTVSRSNAIILRACLSVFFNSMVEGQGISLNGVRE